MQTPAWTRHSRGRYPPPLRRRAELLQRLAALAKWEKRPSPQKQTSGGEIARGRGLTYVKYELTRTYVGAVAEVEVNRKTGEIRVTRFYVVHDCGQIINPDGLKNQLEGNVIQTVSRTLFEEVTSVDGGEPRLGELPDHHIPGCARGGHGPHRPAE